MLVWILGLVGLGLMVFIHELGHFVAARLCGVEVEVFSLGWGPRLVGFTHKGTLYQISWLPIGGYCKMRGELVPGIAGGGPQAAGEGPQAAGEGPQAADGAAAGEVAAGPAPAAPGSFLAAPAWRRIIIAALGPVFNLAFAFIVFTLIWWAGFAVYSSDNRVILATDYSLDSFAAPPAAARAGLMTGDRVTAIDGSAVEKFQDILEMVSAAPGRPFRFTVERQTEAGSRTLELAITPELDKDTGAGRIGIYSWVDPVVDKVASGSAAAIAGLRHGDRIVGANSRQVRNTMDFYQELVTKPAKIDLSFTRDGAAESVPLVLAYDGKGVANVGLSFTSGVYRSPRLGLFGALTKSLEETAGTITLTVKGIGLLFQGVNLRNAVAGPLQIVDFIGRAATSGFQIGFGVGLVSFFRFLAFLSVVLFLMNYLPIPALDGGQIVLFVVEIIRGKPLRSQVIWRLQIIGFSVLIMLMLVITLNDVLRFMGR
jgi:regulator of sigma E protease